MYGKSHRQHYLTLPDKTSRSFELIHIDLWGPAPQISNNGKKYYMSIIDDFRRYTSIFPLSDKAQTTIPLANLKSY